MSIAPAVTTDQSSLLQMTGLSSGVDTSAIVSSLMQIASLPKTQITMKQAAAQAKQNALQTIEAKLKTLSTAAQALNGIGTWAPAQTANSSDTTKVTASVTSGAGPGGYSIGVQNLASSEQHTFAYTPQGTDSSITIGSDTVPVPANSTVDSVVSSINSDSTSPVFAVNVNGNLVMAAKTTGAASAFSATGGSLAEDTTKARVGQDAHYTVDGQSFSSSTNVVSNGLPGVSLTLVGKTTSDVAVNVSNPGPDQTGITKALTAFTNAYNDALTTMQSYTQTKPVNNPQSTSDATTGVLFADSGLNSLIDNLRSTVGSAFSPTGGASGDPTLLSQLGLSTGAAAASGFSQDSVAGKLTLDTGALATALSNNPLGVQRLLGGVTGSTGLAQSMASVLNPQTQAGGLFDQEITSTTNDVSDLSDQLTEINQRLTARQAFLTAQFNHMELALQKSQAQASALSAKLSSLSASS